MARPDTVKTPGQREWPEHPIDWPPSQLLQAGAFSATFDRGDIAHVSMRGHELIRLIYVAIRDPWWHTIPATPLSVHIEASPTHFEAHVHAVTTGASLDLDWQLEVSGFSDGRLQVAFRAKACQACDFARIGLCLHLDAALFSKACWATDGDAGTRGGQFPARIHPQYLVDGIHLPCIPAFSDMRISLDADTGLDIRLEGDLFEIEDQRNWTDASFKAYTTPLAWGELHHLAAGDTIQQKLRIAVRAPAQARTVRQAGVIQAAPLAPMPHGLPALGAALPLPEASPVPSPSIDFAHWRLDVRSAADVHALAAHIAEIPDTPAIELVLHHEACSHHELEQLLATVTRITPLARLILLGAPECLPSPAQVLAVKAMTAGILPDLPVGAGGADAYADLARNPGNFGCIDFVAFPVSPQNHVFDTLSIFETLPVQEQVVREASQRTANGQVAVSTLTFGTQAFDLQSNHFQARRDQRLAHVGTAWLGASLGRLAQGGATAITLAPDLWMTADLLPSMAALLQIVGSLNKAQLLPFEVDDPHRVFLFGARQDDETIVFLINLSGQRQLIHLNGLSQGHATTLQAPTMKSADTPCPETPTMKSADTPCPETPISMASPIELHPYQLRILRHQPTSSP